MPTKKPAASAAKSKSVPPVKPARTRKPPVVTQDAPPPPDSSAPPQPHEIESSAVEKVENKRSKENPEGTPSYKATVKTTQVQQNGKKKSFTFTRTYPPGIRPETITTEIQGSKFLSEVWEEGK